MSGAVPLLMGLDIGSSAIKGIVIDAMGSTIRAAQSGVHLVHGTDGRVELDPLVHLQDVYQVLHTLSDHLTRPIAAMAMSAASGNTLLCDHEGHPLTPIISWMDERVRTRLPRALDLLESAEVHRTTGWPQVDSFPLAHLAWLRESLPDLYGEAAHCCMSTDWILFHLTGNWVMDHSMATTFRLQNQEARSYHQPYLELLDLTNDRLSHLAPSGAVAGTVTAVGATRSRLPVGTPVFLGSFDHPSAARSAGVLIPGQLLLSCGTSWVGFFPEQDRNAILDAGLLCDPFLSDRGGPWGAMFSVPNIGQTIEWYVHNVVAPGADDPYRWFDEAAAAANPGANGLRIDMREKPHHVTGDSGSIARAVMEGAARLVNEHLKLLADKGITFSEAVMVGGPARSRTWPRIVQDTTGISIAVGSTHAGARGAALMAGIGAAIYQDEADAFTATEGGQG